jgi:hypothetical protein
MPKPSQGQLLQVSERQSGALRVENPGGRQPAQGRYHLEIDQMRRGKSLSAET